MALVGGSLSIEDYDGETATVTFNLLDSGVAAANLPTAFNDLDELGDAVAPLIVGRIRKRNLDVSFPDDAAAVTNVQAAREGKWLVSYRDTTVYLGAANTIPNPGYGRVFKIEIPTANRALLTGNSDILDPDSAEFIAFKPIFEANQRSPYNRTAGAGVTATIELLEIRFVGRNL